MGNRYSGDKNVVETIYGKHSVYEIVKSTGWISASYSIYRNGNYHRGSFSDLSKAIAAAQKDG